MFEIAASMILQYISLGAKYILLIVEHEEKHRRTNINEKMIISLIFITIIIIT